MKKEKEIYEEKLRSGSMIDHKSMKEIDEKKRELIREMSLPSNEDFTTVFKENEYHSKRNKPSGFKFENDNKSLRDISKLFYG